MRTLCMTQALPQHAPHGTGPCTAAPRPVRLRCSRRASGVPRLLASRASARAWPNSWRTLSSGAEGACFYRIRGSAHRRTQIAPGHMARSRESACLTAHARLLPGLAPRCDHAGQAWVAPCSESAGTRRTPPGSQCAGARRRATAPARSLLFSSICSLKSLKRFAHTRTRHGC